MLSICEQTSMSATATTAVATHTTNTQHRTQQEEPKQTSAQQVFNIVVNAPCKRHWYTQPPVFDKLGQSRCMAMRKMYV